MYKYCFHLEWTFFEVKLHGEAEKHKIKAIRAKKPTQNTIFCENDEKMLRKMTILRKICFFFVNNSLLLWSNALIFTVNRISNL